MKNLFLLSWLALAFPACQSSTANFSGKLEGNKSREMVVHIPGIHADSITAIIPVEADGSFSFSLPADKEQVIEIEARKDYLTFPVILQNGVYTLVAKDKDYYFSGGDNSLQELFATRLRESRQKENEYNQLCRGYDTISDIRRKAEMSELLSRKFKENEAFRLENIRTFAGTEIAQYIIFKVLYYYENDYNAFSRAIEALGDSIPESAMKTAIFSAYGKLEAAQLTGKAPAFTLEDDKGVAVSLSDFRGKYVLIDFWASWCAPCRAKNKELFKQYPQLQKAGMEVISISLDDNKEKWLEAIRTDGVNWIQLSDLKGFKESKVARDYKIKQVPTVYLIGPEGDVIKTNPTVGEIEEVLSSSLQSGR